MNQVSFETSRIEKILEILEHLAGGDTGIRLPLSAKRDHLDAIAHGVNGIAQELVYSKEAADAASQAKTRFLAVMSHEIRTPLAAIIGLSEYLRLAELSDEERSGALERIRVNGRQLLAIVDNVLDLAKIEAGKIEIVKEWVSPRALLSEVVRALDYLAKEKGLTLELSEASTVPELIEADPLRLRQVLTIVIGNALKFTTSGKVKVEMSCVRGPAFEVSVSDTGIGIPADAQARLFQPFQQAEHSCGGTGLGLELGRRFARLMLGDLVLRKSSPGVGSVFVLSLPLSERRCPESARPKPVEDQRYTGSNRLSGRRVIVAEDSRDLQMIFRTFLELEGAEVQVAENGLEALAAAQASAHDLILLDVNMPKMGGIEAAQRLRARGFSAPIVALTAHALGLHEKECLDAGFSACLSKPFYPETLTQLLLKLLPKSEPEDGHS